MDAASIGREFKPSGHPIALHVDDVEAARAELESKGVEFLAETIDSGVCHMAHLQRPRRQRPDVPQPLRAEALLAGQSYRAPAHRTQEVFAWSRCGRFRSTSS